MSSQIDETITNESLGFPESVLVLIEAEARKNIKNGVTYECVNGHKFKGKEVVVEINEEEDGTVHATLLCPDCRIDKILIPSPAIRVDMRIR